LPETEKNAAAVERAHHETIEGIFEQPWFETGELVERLLAPVRGSKARERKLLADYLPERRVFWTRACAMSAFVLKMDSKTHGRLARNLALVGREIAGGAPLERIPLMRRIADLTVSAYESRL
jgi:hypothetical protein